MASIILQCAVDAVQCLFKPLWSKTNPTAQKVSSATLIIPEVAAIIAEYAAPRAENQMSMAIAHDLTRVPFFEQAVGPTPHYYFQLPQLPPFSTDETPSAMSHGVMLSEMGLSILIHRQDEFGATVICRYVIVLAQHFTYTKITYRLRATQEVRPADGAAARVEVCPQDLRLYTAEELGKMLAAAGQVVPYKA